MKTYDINDVLKVGNPLDDGSNFKCIKCNEKGELTFAPYPIIDWGCGLCGEWQQEENLTLLKVRLGLGKQNALESISEGQFLKKGEE